MSNVQQYPLFYRVMAYMLGGGRGQKYVVLAWDQAAVEAWAHREFGPGYSLVYDEIGPTLKPKDMGGSPNPTMINACCIETPKNTALALYNALIDGTETLGDLGDAWGPHVYVDLIYLLGAMMENDATGIGKAHIQLFSGVPGSDHIIQALTQIKDESPDLAQAIDAALALCRVIEG